MLRLYRTKYTHISTSKTRGLWTRAEKCTNSDILVVILYYLLFCKMLLLGGTRQRRCQISLHSCLPLYMVNIQFLHLRVSLWKSSLAQSGATGSTFLSLKGCNVQYLQSQSLSHQSTQPLPKPMQNELWAKENQGNVHCEFPRKSIPIDFFHYIDFWPKKKSGKCDSTNCSLLPNHLSLSLCALSTPLLKKGFNFRFPISLLKEAAPISPPALGTSSQMVSYSRQAEHRRV